MWVSKRRRENSANDSKRIKMGEKHGTGARKERDKRIQREKNKKFVYKEAISYHALGQKVPLLEHRREKKTGRTGERDCK